MGGRPRKVVTTAVEHPAVLGACASLAECVRVPVFSSGALDLDALKRARFVRITGAGLRESHPHDITITKDSPNYRRS